VIEGITEVLAGIGVPPEATWVLINDHPAGNWAQGGKLLSEK